MDEDILTLLDPVLNWIDWFAPTAHLPYDLNVSETGSNALIRTNKVLKVK